MTKFVLLYTGGTMPESEADQAAIMQAWGNWYAKVGGDVVDGGNPFSNAKHVTDKGVGDGAVSSPPATGYTIISADSLDDAVMKVLGHPHLSYGGQVTVHETFEM